MLSPLGASCITGTLGNNCRPDATASERWQRCQAAGGSCHSCSRRRRRQRSGVPASGRCSHKQLPTTQFSARQAAHSTCQHTRQVMLQLCWGCFAKGWGPTKPPRARFCQALPGLTRWGQGGGGLLLAADVYLAIPPPPPSFLRLHAGICSWSAFLCRPPSLSPQAAAAAAAVMLHIHHALPLCLPCLSERRAC